MDEVVQVNVAKGGQGYAGPNEFNLEPKVGQPTVEGEVELVGLIKTYVRDSRMQNVGVGNWDDKPFLVLPLYVCC